MATVQTICKYNQSGYCKFVSLCRKQHVMEICQNSQCNDRTCVLRHPMICKYFLNFGKCKFGEDCAYLHHSKDKSADIEVQDLKNQLCEMKNKIKNLEDVLFKLNQLEIRLESLESVNLISNESETSVEVKRCITDRYSNPTSSPIILDLDLPNFRQGHVTETNIPQLDGCNQTMPNYYQPKLKPPLEHPYCKSCRKASYTIGDFNYHNNTKFGREDCAILKSML